MPLSNRQFRIILAFTMVLIVVVGLSLVISSTSPDRGYGECYGDCEKVKGGNIDSHGGWGNTYTDVLVVFEEDFTGKVRVETYGSNHVVNGVRESEVNGEDYVEMSFDNFKTHKRFKVFVEEYQ